MKRFVVAVFVVVVLSLFAVGCGQSQVQNSNSGDDGDNSSVATQLQLQSTQEEVNEVETQPPTERTVDTKGEYPWYFFNSDKIAEMQADGETVYLVRDAEPLENAILKFANAEEEEGIPKAPAAESWTVYLDTFLSEVEPYMPEEYIEKMTEVKNALQIYDYELVAKLIEEASKLR